ncbi:MAG: DUF6644 family protein [Caulobacteraceae bacterium]
MALTDLFKSLQESPVGLAIRESGWMFPTIESIHVLAIVLVAGSIAMVDLRLLGVSSRNHAVTKLSTEVLPWVWTAFVFAAITGSLLFVSNASKYFINVPFRLKLLCMACAGLNMLIFNLVTSRSIQNWDSSTGTPTAAKVAGGLSLLFWILVIAFGRWIGFTI